MTDDLMDRRSFMNAAVWTAGLGLGAMGAGVVPAMAQPSPPPGFSDNPREPGFNPLNPHHNFELFARMQGNVAGKPGVGWYSGRVYGVVGDDQVLQPLFDLEGFGINRLERQPDGSYRKFHREVGFYKDLRTGRILENWTNPFTGEIVKVAHIANDPVNSRYAPTYRMSFGEGGDAASFPFLLPWRTVDGLAMASFDVNTRWRNVLDPAVWRRESTGPWIRVSEYLQMYVKPDDVANWRNLETVDNHGGWQRLGPWLPWMMMGGQPGHLFYRSHTKKLPGGVDQIPADIRAYAEKNYAKFLSPPETWVEPNLTSFENYRLNNTPSERPGPTDPNWKPRGA